MRRSSRLHRLGLCLTLAACGPAPLPGQTDAEGNACPLTAPRGEVTIVAYPGEAWVGVDVVGRFQRSTPAREAIACERRAVGACDVTECRNVGVDFVDGEPVCGPTSGGAVLFARGGAAPTRVDGSARLTLDRALVPGEAFGVRTTGGDVPPFAATVALPQRATVTGPAALTRGGSLTLSATENLTVTWAPTTSRVLVVAGANNGGSFTAECAFDGAAGVGVVPAAALPSGGNVEVWTEERVDQQAGVFPVMVRVRWTTGARALFARGP